MYRDPPGIGTEQSWHLAFDQGLRFGTDFVFTYGPLGFLSVRFPFESTRLLLILSDVFLWANLVAVFLWLAKRLKTLREALALLFAVLCIDGAFYFLQLVIVQFAIFGFWLFHYLRSPNILILMNAAVLSLLMFFIKLNIGLPAMALMILFLVHRSFSPEGRHSALLFLGAYFLTLLALPTVIPVDLLPYIRSSLEIARGYNDAMFLPLVANEHYPLLALVIIGSWVGVLVFHRSEIWREKTA